LNRSYQKYDLDKIAKGQLEAEKMKAEFANNILVCDTNLIVIKIWSEYKFGSCSDWIVEEISKSNYNLHLLTYIDIPWEEDPQREHPHKRDYLYMKYKEELEFWNFKYVEIKGNMNERYSKAVSEIDTLQ
jgi:nicotinamide riboside kinase